MSLVLVAIMDAIGQRITAEAHQQPQYDLRVLVPPLIREPALAQLVLIIRLKIERGHVVEQHSDVAAQYLSGMPNAYVLNDTVLPP